MQLFWEFQSLAELAEQVEGHLRKGRAFVPGNWEVEEREICEVVLIHPESSEWMPLSAEVVYRASAPPLGVGIELTDHGSSQVDALMCFAQSEELVPPSAALSSAAVDGSPASDGSPDSEMSPSRRAGSSVRPPSSEAFALNVNQRVRQLGARDREKLARKGTLSERTALERAFGAPLWEALLSNPHVTSPEVARIAKNGTVTQPILRIIVANTVWVTKSEVRRALLSNPRLTAPHIDRVLRTVPRLELQKIPMQTAYPAQVRAAASKFLPPR